MRNRWNASLPGRPAVFWLMLLFLLSAATAQSAQSGQPLTVESAAGAVKLRQGARWETPSAGMHVALPAVVSTGGDGSIKLTQGGTVIAVAANTAVELYKGETTGETLQRVVQSRGSAFYDVAPREKSRLRVETPYLVAVIKGTEFNVNVTAESSTVALFEGRLQIEAPDTGEVVDLLEGHIARRHKDDRVITVIRMDDGEPLVRNATPAVGGGSADGGPADAASVPGVAAGGGDDGDEPGIGIAPVDTLADRGIGNTGTEAALPSGDTGGLIDDKSFGDTRLGLEIAGYPAGLDVDIGLNAGELASVDAGLDAGVDLGSGELDVGADVGADVAGLASVDAGLDAGVDLGSGELDLGADVGADVGDLASVDAGLDAGVDLGSGDLDVGADVGADVGGLVGVDAGVDAGSGGVDLDASVAGVDLDLGLDAGGGLDGLLDVELDVDLLDDSDDSEGDDTEDAPILDLRRLLNF